MTNSKEKKCSRHVVTEYMPPTCLCGLVYIYIYIMKMYKIKNTRHSEFDLILFYGISTTVG